MFALHRSFRRVGDCSRWKALRQVAVLLATFEHYDFAAQRVSRSSGQEDGGPRLRDEVCETVSLLLVAENSRLRR